MPKKTNTYYVAKPLSIQSKAFNPGDVLGTGDVDFEKSTGNFKPEKGLEDYVALGHVAARLADGRVVDQWPIPKPKSSKKASIVQDDQPESSETAENESE